jgi:steroid 5-alpha reductase family enzyme
MMFLILGLIFPAVFIVLAIAVFGFLLALWKKDNSIADVLYGWYFIILASFACFFSFSLGSFYEHTGNFVAYALTLMVYVWGIRLSWRVYLKNKGKPEDFRYAAWRKSWTWFRLRSFFQVFLLQGLITLIIASPALLVILAGPKITPIVLLGIIAWLVGFTFELVGDWQLDHFLKDPTSKGKLMTTGLWKYSRHPNYFGESLMWWGIWLVSLSAFSMLWYVTIISPVLITFLLVKVSGIPLLEARMSQHPDWAAYASKTNALIPWVTKDTPL